MRQKYMVSHSDRFTVLIKHVKFFKTINVFNNDCPEIFKIKTRSNNSIRQKLLDSKKKSKKEIPKERFIKPISTLKCYINIQVL